MSYYTKLHWYKTDLYLDFLFFYPAALYSWYEEYIVMDFSTPYVRTGVTCIAPSPRYSFFSASRFIPYVTS